MKSEKLQFKIKNFQNCVYEIVKRIPKGKVMTYKEVGQKAGGSRAWRAVGNILRHSAELSRSHKNKDPKIPCHRVIRSNGRIGGYKNGTKRKISLLKKEGIIINSYGKVTSRATK